MSQTQMLVNWDADLTEFDTENMMICFDAPPPFHLLSKTSFQGIDLDQRRLCLLQKIYGVSLEELKTALEREEYSLADLEI